MLLSSFRCSWRFIWYSVSQYFLTIWKFIHHSCVEIGLASFHFYITCCCCRHFAVLEDSFDTQFLNIFWQVKFVHHSCIKIGPTSFHFYITSINSMIRWKRKKAKYPDEKFAKGWKNCLKKLLTLARIVCRSSVSISQFFSSCQLLAQNWILNMALECKSTLQGI